MLVEADGVKSAIRIVDRVTHQVAGPNPPQEMESFQYQLMMLVSLKSGWIRGSRCLRFQLAKPSGERPEPFEQTVFFEGEEERGVDIIVKMDLKLEQPGLHWIHVLFEDRELSRIPLRVIYVPQVIRART